MKNTLVLTRTEMTAAPVSSENATNREDAILARLFADEEGSIQAAAAAEAEARRQTAAAMPQTTSRQSPARARYSYD